MLYRIRNRSDSAFDWTHANPILLDGEPGLEKDTLKLKFGDGVHHWVDLPYFTGGFQGGDPGDNGLLEHINDETPHPAYDNDNGPSLVLLYENAKV